MFSLLGPMIYAYYLMLIILFPFCRLTSLEAKLVFLPVMKADPFLSVVLAASPKVVTYCRLESRSSTALNKFVLLLSFNLLWLILRRWLIVIGLLARSM